MTKLLEFRREAKVGRNSEFPWQNAFLEVWTSFEMRSESHGYRGQLFLARLRKGHCLKADTFVGWFGFCIAHEFV